MVQLQAGLRMLLHWTHKIQKAIDAVGKEKGFTYILDVATGTTVFIGDGAVDVTKDVKGKLGIK